MYTIRQRSILLYRSLRLSTTRPAYAHLEHC